MVASIFYFIYAVGFVVFLAAAIVILAARQGSQSDEKIKSDKTNGGYASLSSYTKYAKKIPARLIGWWFIFVFLTVLINNWKYHKDPISLAVIIIVLTLIMYFIYWLVLGPLGRSIRDSQALWLVLFALCVAFFYFVFNSGLEWITEWKFVDFFSHL